MAGAAVATTISAPQLERGKRPRVDSVDLLRGIVMVIMALDHMRDWTSNVVQTVDPTDLASTWPALFFTRWITHFCAPTFVFLAGTGAYLYASRNRSLSELSRFLWTRGVWLVFLELTVVRFGWLWNFHPPLIAFLQVIWAIGLAMVVLSGLVRFGPKIIGILGVAIIALHNLLDPISAASFGSWAPLWNALHQPAGIPVGKSGFVLMAYPVLAWCGVMLCGYAFGVLFTKPQEISRPLMRRIGLSMTAAFLVIRAIDWYGDPSRWTFQKNVLYTVMSFLNTTKYPPSLLYTLMTLGPAIFFLGMAPAVARGVWAPLVTFGRVPLFFYLLHQNLEHALTFMYSLFKYGTASWLLNGPGARDIFGQPPQGFGVGLPGVYLFWIITIILLYPACKWFAGVKQRRREVWLSYL